MVNYAPQNYLIVTMRQNFPQTKDYPKRNINDFFVTLQRQIFIDN